MKKMLILMIFIIHFLGGAQAQELFLQAQQAYREKKIEKALEIYNSIEPKNDVVWLCIGNCYGEMDQPIQALIAWEKARISCFQLSRIKMIQENIQKIKNKLSLPKISFKASVMNAIDTYARIVPLLWWQIIFLAFWFLFITSGMWLIRRKYYIRIVSLISAGALCMVIIVTRYQALARVASIAIKPSAICLSTDLRLVSGKTVVPGQQLRVLQKNDGWCKIVSDNNDIGWVPNETITLL